MIVQILPTGRGAAVSRDLCMMALWIGMAIGLTWIAPPPEMRDQFVLSVVARSVLAILCLAGILRLIWRLRGREEITLQGGLLVVVWRLGGMALQRSFRVEHVRDLHISGIDLPNYWGVVGGTLRFHDECGTNTFADRLGREEAKTLLKLFRERLPETNWTPVLGL